MTSKRKTSEPKEEIVTLGPIVKLGEHIFGVAHIFVSFNDTFCKVKDKFPLEMDEIQAAVVAADINDDGAIELVTADAHGNVAAWTKMERKFVKHM